MTAADPAYEFPTSPRTLSAAATDVEFEGDLKACTGGNPTSKAEPCVITRLKQLQNIQDDLSGHYALGADIDGTPTRRWDDGKGFEPIGTLARQFSGSLDGAGRTITNLFIDRPDRRSVGLFGRVDEGAEIKSVNLVGVDITGEQDIGALAGISAGTIERSSASGSLDGEQYVGGLVGRSSGLIRNSSSTGNVSASGNNVGGLVGYNTSDGAITASHSSSSVTGHWWVGGLVGNNNATIETSYSTGHAEGDTRVGGLSGGGTVNAVIINSYSTAAVTTTTSAAKGNGYAGGLVGLNSTGTIKTSYSTGPVSHANIWGVGGLVGYDHHDNGAFESNYWDVETSGMTTSKGADPMTTTEMKQQATYQGWDFDDVWSIDEGKDYPDLRSNPR